MRKGRLVYLYEVISILQEHHRKCPACYNGMGRLRGHTRQLESILAQTQSPEDDSDLLIETPTIVVMVEPEDSDRVILDKLGEAMSSANIEGTTMNPVERPTRVALLFR